MTLSPTVYAANLAPCRYTMRRLAAASRRKR